MNLNRARYCGVICVSVWLLLTSGCSRPALKQYSKPQVSPHKLLRATEYSGKKFTLSAWQRINRPGQSINIYIEGDGAAWQSRTRVSRDPTPKSPIAWQLAAQDPSDNVIYLARPCQFLPQQSSPATDACDDARYWTSHRFSRVILDEYLAIIEQIAKRYQAPQFHLIGFSGGANIAGLIAANRRDIASLRSVAGNLDNDYFVAIHKVSPMPHALNMANLAHALAHIPQVHFIGADDKIIPASIFQQFTAKLPSIHCVDSRVIAKASHQDGWVDNWKTLLAIVPVCTAINNE